MRHWIEDLLNVFFPAECHVCGNSLASHERFLCVHCMEALPRTGYHRDPHNPMEQRIAGKLPFVAATGHFFYSKDSALSKLIQDMKYRGYSSIGNFLGEIAGSELFTTGFLSDIDIIVPVPMYFLKKARRGYNQTENIAAGMSKVSGIPVCNALKMTKDRKTQTALSQSERMKNASSVFTVRKNLDLNNKNILVLDDICTTGATIAAASKTIHTSFPQSRIYLFALGVTF